jgi:hypothetical protein
VGDTSSYTKVFIHQFVPLLYRWVAKNNFKELNWMVWGADLYNLPAFESGCYERRTLEEFIKKKFTLGAMAYRLKIFLLHERFRKTAYSKINHVLTWMKSEFDFANRNIKTLKARHEFFFYENQLPYQNLDRYVVQEVFKQDKTPRLIVGNSSSPSLNHLEAVENLQKQHVKADLVIPVSYGDENYSRFLKKRLQFYTGGKIDFLEKYMNFPEYLAFLGEVDGLVMNNIRPQGYGNIFMMMYLGKNVYLNERNISLQDLTKNGLTWFPLNKIEQTLFSTFTDNKEAVNRLLSHGNVLRIYGKLFS